jgi:hypothetical protein
MVCLGKEDGACELGLEKPKFNKQFANMIHFVTTDTLTTNLGEVTSIIFQMACKKM